MYLTTDHGKNFKRIKLDFTPSDVSFHELQPSTFVVLDKNDLSQKVSAIAVSEEIYKIKKKVCDNLYVCFQFWITEDFGKSFRLAHEFVKSFYWMKDSSDNQQLLLQRYEPNGLSTIIFSRNLFRSRASHIYTTNVKDFFFKGDYLFTTKINVKVSIPMFCREAFAQIRQIKTYKSYLYLLDFIRNKYLLKKNFCLLRL